MKLERIVEQENGSVKFWVEDFNNNIIASLVNGDFPDEMEIRISKGSDRFSVRGHRIIMDKFTFDQFHDRVLFHLDRHNKMNICCEKMIAVECAEGKICVMCGHTEDKI